jgi:hypothetical protein
LAPLSAKADFPRFEGDAVVTVPDVRNSDTEESILDVARAPSTQSDNLHSYILFRTIRFNPGKENSFQARIWEPLIQKWPGSNCQIIEIVRNGKRMSSTKVGGSPMMKDAWGAVDHQADNDFSYIYILCGHRHRSAPGIYSYRINENFSISECGVVFLKTELTKEAEEIQQFLDKTTNEHSKK